MTDVRRLTYGFCAADRWVETPTNDHDEAIGRPFAWAMRRGTLAVNGGLGRSATKNRGFSLRIEHT